MHPYRSAWTWIAAAALAASPSYAARGDSADGGTASITVVLEPGKPMRFETVTPPALAVQGDVAGGGGPECALHAPLDRRTTPSSACTQCHDGSKALNASTGHRYDMEYFVRPGGDLRTNPEQFNSAVVLANGKVTCLSCHDSASRLVYHLAAPTGGEVARRLCVACHIH